MNKFRFYWIILGFISLAILPIGLNYMLQLSIVEHIISSPESGPGVWLVFLGSYLAAIGSFTMAMISYVQNKNLINDNAKKFNFEIRIRQYEQLERFVKYSCTLHSACIINDIIRTAEKGLYDVAITTCEKFLFDISFTSSSICHYQNIFNEVEMREFGEELSKENLRYLNYAHQLLSLLNDVKAGNEGVNKLLIFIKDATIITELQQKGHRLLKAEMERVNNIHSIFKKTNNEKKIITNVMCVDDVPYGM